MPRTRWTSHFPLRVLFCSQDVVHQPRQPLGKVRDISKGAHVQLQQASNDNMQPPAKTVISANEGWHDIKFNPPEV